MNKNYTEKINCEQNYKGEIIKFDVDSSPKAWAHYKEYYKKEFGKEYKLAEPTFYFYDNKNKPEKDYTYSNREDKGYNRLYALKNDIECKEFNNIMYYKAGMVLGGECDFNFNESKYKLFKKIIGQDNVLLKKLEYCHDMHHTLANFSLILKSGNMQRHKGKNRFDRFDVFAADIADYFRGLSIAILDSATEINIGILKKYLSRFDDVYDYMKRVYFIDNKELVNRIITQGREPIENKNDVERYMDLAKCYWEMRVDYFKANCSERSESLDS